MERLTESIGAATDGERLDRVVALLTGKSRSAVAELVTAGAVRVDGNVVTSRSRRVVTGDVLSVDLPDPGDGRLRPDPAVPFDVVFADEHLLVVDKPAGVVVHPGAGNAEGTLVHGLIARFPEIASVGDEGRPGIVHRLDRGTSGLLMVARTAAAHETLSAMMAAHAVERTYLGVVAGHVTDDEGVVDAPIGRSNRQPTKMTVTREGRDARTRYRVLMRARKPVPASVVEFQLETGRTHQIRVHMAAIGHPLFGDHAYGGAGDLFDRVALHARRLRFTHPVDGSPCEVVADVPADLAALVDSLSQ